MWTSMPSSTTHDEEEFFSYEDVKTLASSLPTVAPVLKGKVWPNEDRGGAWTIECESFEDFQGVLAPVSGRIEFIAYDESFLDEDILAATRDDLSHFAEEEGYGRDLVTKAIAALKSHEHELFAVHAYAFLQSGHVIFVRAQSELAPYLYQPDRLLSTEGLSQVRKLKTLAKS
ncbi:MAG: hypothetical protein AB1540_14720 [Bdellovibrionota bacterium]